MNDSIGRRHFLKTTSFSLAAAAITGAASSIVRAADAASRPASAPTTARVARTPLFRDPIFDGPTDPTLIYNRAAKEWWMFYTARRANVETEGVAWVHGTDLGIASSTDGGRSWLYRGTAQGLNVQPGRNTFWAPEIIWHDDLYHMYVSYITGVPTAWVGNRDILHYTSKNLWDWALMGQLELSSRRVIDACVWPLPGGGWRMWYKDEAHKSNIFAAESQNLNDWTVIGPVITNRGQEGPNVFRYRGAYWMVTDMWQGLFVHRSDDLMTWKLQQGKLLDKPGKRPTDDAIGHHAFLLSQGEDDAVMFYFTEPDKRHARVQVAALDLQDDQLICNRDVAPSLDLKPELTAQIRGGSL